MTFFTILPLDAFHVTESGVTKTFDKPKKMPPSIFFLSLNITKKKPDSKAKNNAFKSSLDVDRPRTRAYIKQETENNKEYLKCALYSPVKVEVPSLEIISKC